MSKCCFVGYSSFEMKKSYKIALRIIIKDLINRGVDTFCFYEKSLLSDLCYDLVGKFKHLYPHIKRVYYLESKDALNAKSNNKFLKRRKLKAFDEYIMVEEHTFKSHKMIDDCQYCVFSFHKVLNKIEASYEIIEHEDISLLYKYATACEKHIIEL